MPNLREFGNPAAPAGVAVTGPPTASLSAAALLEKLRARPLDLRLEVVLADLLAHGYSFDDFVVRPVGLFARRYRRDLGSVSEEVVEQGTQLATVVEVHREGLYDAVPQQLFHQPGDPEARPGVTAMVQDIRTQRRREKASRRFFLPFEQEFYRFRVLVEQEERRYMTNLSAQWYNDVLARFWELDTPLPPRPLTALLHLLPLAHRIVGDLPRVQQVFETILETPVRLRLTAPITLPDVAAAAGSPAAGATLGLGQLGRDFVLSGDYQETLPALEIQLYSLSPAALAGFLSPDTWQVRALHLLCRYFVSFETDVVLRYELADDSRSFRLQDEGETAILGYSTVGLEA
jgi:type VI secretion system protein ImpH